MLQIENRRHYDEQELTGGSERMLVATEVSWRGLQSAMAVAAARDDGDSDVLVDLELGCINQLVDHDHGFEATQEREEEQVETYRSKQEPVAELRRRSDRQWRRRARAGAVDGETACGRR
jgi:hypothetical protein